MGRPALRRTRVTSSESCREGTWPRAAGDRSRRCSTADPECATTCCSLYSIRYSECDTQLRFWEEKKAGYFRRAQRIWHGASAPSPRLPSGRLRPSSTGYGEGRGEGAFPQAQTRGDAPSPRTSGQKTARSTSSPPRGGGGGAAQAGE